MTPKEEENMLIDKLMSARQAVMDAKAAHAITSNQLAHMKSLEEECEQALIDYMQGNGLTYFEDEFSSYSLRKSRSVDIVDEDAVPSKYLRTKTEINKALIRAESLDPKDYNWLQYKDSVNLHIKAKS